MGARDFDFEALRRETVCAFLRPPPRLSCADWADTHRQIVKGPEKGRWRTDRTPYLREPMECTDPDHPAQKIVMQFATQLGKTEVLYNALFKRIHLAPVDMMMVQPTLNDAKDHSRQRFTPTVKKMPEILELLAPPRSREEQNTWQTKEVRGGATLFFAGANSARSLASKPLGFVICDEIDGYPQDVDGEGDPLGLVWERMSNFPTRKMLLCSTPTLKGASRIEAEYEASDRRRYFVPCSHCAAIQVLEWGETSEWGIKWLTTPTGAARPETAVYICRECGAAIEERNKPVMLHDGRWIAEVPDAQRGLVIGFHLSKIYSPLGWKSWAMLAEDWAKAQTAKRSGDNSKLKTFRNTSLAQTYEDSGDGAEEHELRRRAADIPMRVVQPDHSVCTLGVDVQGDRLHIGLWAWGRSRRRQLVDRLAIYGDPAIPEDQTGSPWAELTEYRRTAIEHLYGATVPLLATMVDSGGHHTQAVYTYCRAHAAERVNAVKGQSQAGKSICGSTPTVVGVNIRGQKLKRGAVKLWPVGTDTAKADIYGCLRTLAPGPGYALLSKHMESQAFEQLTSERLVTRYLRGRPKMEWVLPPGRQNEDLDCAVYALAGAHWAGVERWRDADWRKWEKRLAVPKPDDPKPLKPGEDVPASPPVEPKTAAPAPKRARRRRGVIAGRSGW